MKALRILLILAFVFAGKFLFAQDTIYKVNRETVVARVQEVGTYDIRYKRYSSPDGPVYVIRKTEVNRIVYSDGHVDYFNTSAPRTSAPAQIKEYQNMVAINSFDLLLGVVTAEAEFGLKNNAVSFRIPISFGVAAAAGNQPSYSDNIFYYNRDKMFSTGFKVLFYPSGHSHLANYYLGVTGEYGMVRFREYNYIYPSPSNTTITANFWGTGIVNGVQIHASDRIDISMDFSFGMVISDYSYTSYRPMGRMGLLMAYRFGKLPSSISVSG